ncbi:MAG: L-histidine N(alpha)-methyltransferase [Rhodothermales bacterium]
MYSNSNLSVDSRIDITKHTDKDHAFLSDVLSGLSASQKRLPSKYFYDEIGSQLFDEICELDEYYPTRTEMGIMEDNIQEIVRFIGPNALLIEYGSGSSLKTRTLLENLKDLAGYVPIDISKEHLLSSAAQLTLDFSHIEVLPVHADYSAEISLPKPTAAVSKKVVYFPGSTIGNFTPEESVAFLERVKMISEEGGGLLIGVDLKKTEHVLEAAYNDAKGVTAAFNLNLLSRINKELNADFDLDAFEHKAIFNTLEGRIEMHLISRAAQIVTIASNKIHFEAGETIHTENSYKYTLAEFAAIGKKAGLKVQRVWTDSRCLFSVQYLTVE